MKRLLLLRQQGQHPLGLIARLIEQRAQCLESGIHPDQIFSSATMRCAIRSAEIEYVPD